MFNFACTSQLLVCVFRASFLGCWKCADKLLKMDKLLFCIKHVDDACYRDHIFAHFIVQLHTYVTTAGVLTEAYKLCILTFCTSYMEYFNIMIYIVS